MFEANWLQTEAALGEVDGVPLAPAMPQIFNLPEMTPKEFNLVVSLNYEGWIERQFARALFLEDWGAPALNHSDVLITSSHQIEHWQLAPFAQGNQVSVASHRTTIVVRPDGSFLIVERELPWVVVDVDGKSHHRILLRDARLKDLFFDVLSRRAELRFTNPRRIYDAAEKKTETLEHSCVRRAGVLAQRTAKDNLTMTATRWLHDVAALPGRPAVADAAQRPLARGCPNGAPDGDNDARQRVLRSSDSHRDRRAAAPQRSRGADQETASAAFADRLRYCAAA